MKIKNEIFMYYITRLLDCWTKSYTKLMEIIFVDDKSDGTMFTIINDINLEAMNFPPAVRRVYWNKPVVDMSVFSVDGEHILCVFIFQKKLLLVI